MDIKFHLHNLRKNHTKKNSFFYRKLMFHLKISFQNLAHTWNDVQCSSFLHSPGIFIWYSMKAYIYDRIKQSHIYIVCYANSSFWCMGKINTKLLFRIVPLVWILPIFAAPVPSPFYANTDFLSSRTHTHAHTRVIAFL